MQINGTERRLFLNSQAELNNPKTWSRQLTSLALSRWKTRLCEGIPVTENQQLTTYFLLMASLRVRYEDSKSFLSVELQKYKSISEVFPSSTFLQGQQELPVCRCSWKPDCKQPPCFSRVKLHGGTGSMWVVVSEEWNLQLQAVLGEQLHGAKLPKGYSGVFSISQDRIVAAIDLSGFFSSNWKSSGITPAWRQPSYTKILPADCFLNGSLSSK